MNATENVVSMASRERYEFGRFRLDVAGRVLFQDGNRIPLAPKAIDLLAALLESSGATVTRQELLSKVWLDAIVEEGTLSSHISLLRKTLGPQFIETIPKRGYRFIGGVKGVAEVAARSRILLAVLPFENLDGNEKYDAFSDGLTDELITQLGRINPTRLGVIARTSSMTYKSTGKTIERIGRELHVSHVVEGSVRRAAGRVRIAVQLIQVSDQTHVWNAVYEGELQDVLTLQSRVARAVASQIQIKLEVAEETRRVVPAAYDAFARGRYLWNRRGANDLQTSVRCFEEALAHDSSYASAYAGKADAYLTLMDHGFVSPDEGIARAREAVEAALRLDETLPEAHVSLGHAAFHAFDWETAERGFRRGIELNPSYSIGHHYYANHLAAMRQLDAAIAEAEQARQLDPISPATRSNVTSILWLARRHEQSIEETRRLLDLAPGFAGAYEDLGRNFEALGDFEKAEEAFLRAAELTGRSAGALASLGYLYGRAGRTTEAEAVLRRIEQIPPSTYVSPYTLALVYLALDRRDEAFRHLDKAFEERSSALPFINVNPRFDIVRDDERLAALAARLRLP